MNFRTHSIALALAFAAAPALAAEPTKNSIGMEFVPVPAGMFNMGCKPPRRVSIARPFSLGRYEVTQEQWQAVMGSNPSTYQGANRPVDGVSWNDVQAFIKKLNAKEGHNRYRLPTEAEWEYADRAGAADADYCKEENNALTAATHAWYGEAIDSGSHPVGGKRPNAWGLYDMHGNVDEWVQDSYTDSGAPEGALRVQRGGHWFNDAGFAGASYRSGAAPDGRSEFSGFRLVLDMDK